MASTLATLAGVAGAVATYQQVGAPLDPDPVTVQAAAQAQEPLVPPPAKVQVRFAKCPQGFERVGDACERTVERTVVVKVAAPAAPAVVHTPVARTESRRSEDRPRAGSDDRGGRDDRDEAGDDRDHDRDDADERDEDDHDDDHDDDHEDDD